MSERNEATAATPAEGRMRAFAGNSFDDYYDHALSDHPLPGRLLIGAIVNILWVLTKFLWPWKIENAERLLDDARGRVLIMNHQSMLDPVAVVTTMWRAHVPVRIVYKSDFDRIVPATWLFSRAGGFPVERGTADMKTVRRARAMLMRGECVLIYPEGTRIRDDADEKPHGGYAIMAQLAKAPVQPIARRSSSARCIVTPRSSAYFFTKPIAVLSAIVPIVPALNTLFLPNSVSV